MNVGRKTWPYGTTKSIKIIEDATDMMIVAFEPETKEGFIILGHTIKELPRKDDVGTIVFEQGGPTGGHWQYYPSTKKD
jgi:hypothetical protein